MRESRYGFWPNRRCGLIGIKTFIIVSVICLFVEGINAFILNRPGYGELLSVLFVISQAGVIGWAVGWGFYMREFDKYYKVNEMIDDEPRCPKCNKSIRYERAHEDDFCEECAENSKDLFEVDSSIWKNTESIPISSSLNEGVLHSEISTYPQGMLLWETRIVLTEIKNPIKTQSENNEVADDSKRELWRILMGDSPMPETSPDAIQEYSDALKSIVTTDSEENPLIQRLRELRGK